MVLSYFFPLLVLCVWGDFKFLLLPRSFAIAKLVAILEKDGLCHFVYSPERKCFKNGEHYRTENNSDGIWKIAYFDAIIIE